MTSKLYVAIILSNYQELGLKRYINHFDIKDKVIVFKYSEDLSANNDLPNNVIKKNFSNKYVFLINFILFMLKNFFYKKKYIFGNPDSKFTTFLRKFISGKKQIYVDDGNGSIHLNFDKLKKDATVFTIFDIKLPAKLKKIKYVPRYIKKKKKYCDKILLIGSALVSKSLISADKFTNLCQVISKKHKKIYYYPHRAEVEELLLLPNNFKIIKRVSSVEEFIYNYKYNFKMIYLFFSSSLFEIICFNKISRIKIIDIYDLFDTTDKNFIKHHKIEKFTKIYEYIRKMKLNIFKPH